MLWTFVYNYLYKCLFSVLLGWNCIYMCRGGTAESYDSLFHFLTSKQTIFGPANHFCNHFTLAPAMFEGSISSHLCQYLFYLFFFYPFLKYSHHCWYQVIFHCGLDLHFLMASDVEHLFMYLFHVCVTVEKCIFKSSVHF